VDLRPTWRITPSSGSRRFRSMKLCVFRLRADPEVIHRKSFVTQSSTGAAILLGIGCQRCLANSSSTLPMFGRLRSGRSLRSSFRLCSASARSFPAVLGLTRTVIWIVCLRFSYPSFVQRPCALLRSDSILHLHAAKYIGKRLCEKMGRWLSLGHPKGIDRLISQVALREYRLQGRQSRACHPDNPKGQTRFFSVPRLPICAHPLPISLAGRSSRSAKSFSSSMFSG